MSRVEVTQETTPLSDGILKTDLPLDGTLQVVKDQLNNSSTLQLSNTTAKVNSTLTVAERLNIESDSTVTTQTSSVIRSTTTNANLVLAPNGTGALVASIPDGTATGGNARGNYSVDLQMQRSNANQVASGPYNVIMGYLNRGGGTFSIAMGESCVSTDTATIAMGSGTTAGSQYAVAFGRSNVCNGQQSTISGGQSNQITGSNYSTISGGQSNTASTNTHATVVGGQSNTASGQLAVAGGWQNTASGSWATAFGRGNTCNATGATAFGQDNVSEAQFGTCLGGSNRASSFSSVVLGYRGQSYLYAQNSLSSGYFTGVGDAQQSLLTARREAAILTSAITVLSLDGTGTTNLIIPNGNNRAWNVQVNWVAVVTAISGTATGISVGDVVTSVDLLGFKRVGGTSSASAHTSAATKLMVTSPAQYAGVTISYTAGASQEMAMAFTGPTFAGGGSVTMRVVARVELSEVAW